jgi:hypothetical protein
MENRRQRQQMLQDIRQEMQRLGIEIDEMPNVEESNLESKNGKFQGKYFSNKNKSHTF